MSHFSKFMRPGAVKIGCEVNNKQLKVTAVQNIDKSIAIALFNPTNEMYTIEIKFDNTIQTISIAAKALQTVVITTTK
jgi:glucosylceramidase